ncbi:MAG TPA: arsenic resistance N-acetyltransferase ArsN2 [Puia sp.]|nr:arsenic resistance N-acetyltransferase ArsN2 [Puia sp.]
MNTVFRQASDDELEDIKKLLQQSDLPVEDISSDKVEFIVAIDSENIVGCIGIESYGTDGLLRSFAVAENFRSNNIGNELLQHLIMYSEQKNIKTLHLLTTTAEKYFLKKSFAIHNRNEAPQTIKQTTEFSEICPSSSVYMQLQLKKKILVLCTGNSCRSQMAEGYLRYFAGDKATIYSAGIETHGVNPRAIAVMNEDGIDISKHTSNNIDEYRNIDFDFVITVCDHAKERCPFFPTSAKKFHHNFPDPAKATGTEEEIAEKFREVKQEIKEYCRQFVADNL